MEIVLTITPTSQISKDQDARREQDKQRTELMMRLAQPLLAYFQELIAPGSSQKHQDSQDVTDGTVGELLHAIMPELDRDVFAGVLRKVAPAMGKADWEEVGERLLTASKRFAVEDLAKLYDELTEQRRAMGLQ